MQARELFLSSFDIKEIVHENGRINHIYLGAGTNFFAVIKQGHAVLTSAEGRVEVQSGELLYIPHGLPYVSEWYGEGGCRFYSLPFNFRYIPENGDYSLQTLNFDGAERLLESIYSHAEKAPAAALAEFYALYAAVAPRLKRRESAFENSRVSKAVRYMESHADKCCDVPALARMCGMSESGFYAEFKRLTGQTPMEYKNILRCRRAVELLCNTSETVESIAEKVGCSDPSYLRRILYKELKKTPKQIRAERELM